MKDSVIYKFIQHMLQCLPCASVITVIQLLDKCTVLNQRRKVTMSIGLLFSGGFNKDKLGCVLLKKQSTECDVGG